MTGNELLWPGGQRTGNLDCESAAEDLELNRLGALLLQGMSGTEALAFLNPIITDDWDSIKMRQAVISDMLHFPPLTDAFTQLCILAEEMSFYRRGLRENAAGLGIDRMDAVIDGIKKKFSGFEKLVSKQGADEMEKLSANTRYAQLLKSVLFMYELVKRYTEAMTLLRDTLAGIPVASCALQSLKTWAEKQYKRDDINAITNKLTEIQSWWKGIGAFAIDVCMDGRMMINSLEVAEIRHEPYAKNGILDGDPQEAREGITNLIQFPQNGSGAVFQAYLQNEVGFEARKELTRLRSEIKWKLSGQDDLISLKDALRFYIAASDMAARLIKRSVPVCAPDRSDFAILDIKDAVSPEMVLTGPVLPVANDIYLGAEGYINLVTGPNNSGKTCYIILAGQLIWLAQLGCLLPCSSASIKPCDSLLTLFNAGESEEGDDSRMGMEVLKLKAITERMTARSLALFNEPMTGTSAGEGISICIDLILELIDKKVSGMMVTHFGDIYAPLAKRLEQAGLFSRLQSLVLSSEKSGNDIEYLYKIINAPPMKSSYARAVIGKLGVTLDNMLSRMDDLGMDIRPDDPAWDMIRRGEVL